MMQELNAQATVTFGLLLEEAIPGRWFVRCAYEGGPAEHAGLMRGDEIVRIDGQPAPSSPWVIAAGYDATSPGGSLCMLGAVEGRELEIVLRRSPAGPLRTVHVRPRKMSSLDAAENSVAVVPLEGRHVGVVHVWYCARDSDDVLRDALEGPLRDCDALVVDLRGRGGYLHVAQRILEIFQPRQGRPPRWNRPAVFLIDGRTRSAKEVMAHVIQRDGLGTLVGERTEGAVLGAGFFPLPDGSYLELPIQDVPVGDVRLEGVGVEPEVRVVAALPYAAGRDPILEQGCEIALRAARGENATVVYEGSY
jgi:carboxyl-terminal processing protease